MLGGKTDPDGSLPNQLHYAAISESKAESCAQFGILTEPERSICVVSESSEVACEGDIGAPLVNGDSLQGLAVTYSRSCKKSENSFSTFLLIKPYIPWIEDRMD